MDENEHSVSSPHIDQTLTAALDCCKCHTPITHMDKYVATFDKRNRFIRAYMHLSCFVDDIRRIVLNNTLGGA